MRMYDAGPVEDPNSSVVASIEEEFIVDILAVVFEVRISFELVVISKLKDDVFDEDPNSPAVVPNCPVTELEVSSFNVVKFPNCVSKLVVLELVSSLRFETFRLKLEVVIAMLEVMLTALLLVDSL